MSVVAPIVEVTVRGLFGRRRIFLLVLLAALPVLIALLIRVAGGRPDADRVLDTLVVRFVMPLVALIVGTTVIGSEIDDGTAVYLMLTVWMRALSLAGIGFSLLSVGSPILVVTAALACASETRDRRRHALRFRGNRRCRARLTRPRPPRAASQHSGDRA